MVLNTIVKDDIRKCLFKSSNIKGSEYNLKNGDLTITFNNDTQYIYSMVAEQDYIHFEGASSQGKILNSKIKSNYKVVRVDFPVPLDEDLFKDSINLNNEDNDK